MKVPSRTSILIFTVLSGLLLAGVILWRVEVRHRQYSKTNGQFEQNYRMSVNALRLAQDAVRVCLRNNGTGLTEIKNPAPPAAVKEQSVRPAEIPPVPQPVMLQGVSWAQAKPVAMVNGKVYQAGDRIGDCTLEEIHTRSIIMRDAAGKDIEIKLMEPSP